MDEMARLRMRLAELEALAARPIAAMPVAPVIPAKADLPVAPEAPVVVAPSTPEPVAIEEEDDTAEEDEEDLVIQAPPRRAREESDTEAVDSPGPGVARNAAALRAAARNSRKRGRVVG
jgi:hypothetical protein